MPRSFVVLATLTFSSTLATGACGTAGSTTNERDADVYAAVIHALLSSEGLGDDIVEGESDTERVVWAGPLDDEPAIPLEVQASVVERLEDVATVRFVDEAAEAIGETAEGEVIREDGVLVLLGPVPAGDRSLSVRARRYSSVDRADRFQLHAEKVDGEWSVGRLEQTTNPGP